MRIVIPEGQTDWKLKWGPFKSAESKGHKAGPDENQIYSLGKEVARGGAFK